MAGPEEDIAEFFDWMAAQEEAASDASELPFQQFSAKDTWKTIRDLKTQQYTAEVTEVVDIRNCEITTAKEVRVVFSHDYIKAYDPWDEIIDTIEDYCDESARLRFAYGWLGEDAADVDFRSNNRGLYVGHSRTLDEPFSLT